MAHSRHTFYDTTLLKSLVNNLVKNGNTIGRSKEIPKNFSCSTDNRRFRDPIVSMIYDMYE